MASKLKIIKDISSRKNQIHNKYTKLENNLLNFDSYLALPHKLIIVDDVSKNIIRNRCVLTGRTRAVSRKLKLTRMSLKSLGSSGYIPGFKKHSW